MINSVPQKLKTAIIEAVNKTYKQGRRSIESLKIEGCRYRGYNGLRCVIGYASLDDDFRNLIKNMKAKDDDFPTTFLTEKKGTQFAACALNDDIKDCIYQDEFCDTIYGSVMERNVIERRSNLAYALNEFADELNLDGYYQHTHVCIDDGLIPADAIKHIDICLELLSKYETQHKT